MVLRILKTLKIRINLKRRMVLKKAFEWTENDFIHGWGYFKDGFKDKDNIKDKDRFKDMDGFEVIAG